MGACGSTNAKDATYTATPAGPTRSAPDLNLQEKGNANGSCSATPPIDAAGRSSKDSCESGVEVIVADMEGGNGDYEQLDAGIVGLEASRASAVLQLQAVQRGRSSRLRTSRWSTESNMSELSFSDTISACIAEACELAIAESAGLETTEPSRSVKIKKRPPLTPKRYRTPKHDGSTPLPFTFMMMGRDREGDTESTCTRSDTTAGLEVGGLEEVVPADEAQSR